MLLSSANTVSRFIEYYKYMNGSKTHRDQTMSDGLTTWISSHIQNGQEFYLLSDPQRTPLGFKVPITWRQQQKKLSRRGASWGGMAHPAKVAVVESRGNAG